ncbi:MAG: hypothetical protein AAFQ67_08790, partial [Pseudomonadota bacterium]
MAIDRLRFEKSKPLRRLSFGLLAAAGLGLVAIQTAPQVRALFDPARASANDALVGSSGPSLWARLTGATEKDKRIEALEAQVRELSRWRAASISMVDRLNAYEDMLNAVGEPPPRGLTARIAAETNGPFSETVLANVGRAQGVEPGFIAVNEGGLTGRVIHL